MHVATQCSRQCSRPGLGESSVYVQMTTTPFENFTEILPAPLYATQNAGFCSQCTYLQKHNPICCTHCAPCETHDELCQILSVCLFFFSFFICAIEYHYHITEFPWRPITTKEYRKNGKKIVIGGQPSSMNRQGYMARKIRLTLK